MNFKIIKIISLFVLCVIIEVAASVSLAQSKPKPAVKPIVPELKKILTATGLPYNIVNDSMAIIPYQGENIASYTVVVQKISDLYIVYTNLTETLPGKIDDTKYKYLLERNDYFDIIKTGLNAETNTAYVRADVYITGINAILLKRIIEQVANVTNILGGDLK